MNLVEFTVRNYKSLRDVKVGFGDYTSLIGENGSGKTSILEALCLFFKDFTTVGGTPSPILREITSLHNKNRPLEFVAKIMLDEKERKDIFPKDVLGKIMENNGVTLNILRQIPKSGEPWSTSYIRIGKVPLVEDNTLVSTGELTKAIGKVAPGRPPEQFKAFLFDPNAGQTNLIGNKLIVLDNIAYHMDDYTDALVRDGKIPFDLLPGEDYKAWAKGKRLKLVENPAAKEDVDMFLSGEIPLTDNQTLQHLQNRIAEKIKGKLKLVPATRNERVEPGERAAFLNNPTIINPLTKLHATSDDAWYEIGSAVEELIDQRLDSVPALSTWEKRLRLPIHLIGGGQQEIIGLLYQIYTASEPIIAIEEPETHLHHNLSRKLFKLLGKLVTKQQLIVATHSEYFADISERNKNWVLEKKGNETKAREIETPEELLKVFGSLGAEPSDRGYPNKILFVAGETEEDILPVWAEKLGVDIKKIRTEALEGEYDQRKIAIINNYIENAQTTAFLMVDNHASEAVKQLLDEEYKLILQGTIEDCYPIATVIQVLNQNFNLTLTEDDIDPGKPRVEEMKRLLKEKVGIPKRRISWKRWIGKDVAKLMSKDDIPREIRDFIMKVGN
jgi:ABC-type lipoprotein export system ATPase subunit